MKKRVVIVLIIVILVLIGFLYQTFAMSNTITKENDTYVVNVSDNTSIELPAKTSKIVYYKLTNTNDGVVRYGIGYSGTNVEAKVYEDSVDSETGLIDYMENKFIKLKLINNGTTSSTITLSTVLGYENGGDLIVPSGVTLVTEVELISNLVKYITWLYRSSEKSPVVNNNITYNTAPSISLMNDRLGGKTESLDGGNIRYYGNNPNNYIYFNCDTYPDTNCELWRIIGVFGDKIKIVRNESIGKYSWDNKDKTTGAETNYGKNDWSDARLMKLLNPSYESETYGGSLYYNAKSGTCYVNQNNATTVCDFTSTGIKNDTTKNLIAEVTYSTAGYNSADLYSNQIYEYERGNIVYSGRSSIWTGKIGLMYPSDYGYASDFTKCQEKINNYNASSCSQNNWIYNFGYLWLLTHVSDMSNRSWSINLSGNASVNGNGNGSSSNGFTVFPSLYLVSDAIKAGGNGSINNPYRLSV